MSEQFDKHDARLAEKARDQLGKPAFKLSPIPASIRRRIERECEDAENPKGMSTHDGRTRIHASDVRMLLKRLDHYEADRTADK